MTRTAAAVLISTMLGLTAPASTFAQDRPTRPIGPVFEDSPSADQTRDQLQRLLRQYPPAVGEVLQRDPSLLNRPDYLAPYPALIAFLAQHPEIARNPSYFLGTFHYDQRDPRERAQERAHEILAVTMGGMAAVTAFVAIISLLVWLIRSVIDHRRWLRLSRVQSDVHTKLMDRLTNNEDLLAYIQSPAGRRFLESAPITLEGEPRPTTAPLSRILWSVQAGIVLVALGVGFWFAQQRVLPEVAEGFYVLGVVATALGLGFTVSAVASYFISTRLGLVSPRRPVTDA